MTNINIVALVNRANSGDDEKAFAVQTELQAKLKELGHIVTISNVNVTSSKELLELHANIAKLNGYSIVLGGGGHCIKPLADINKIPALKGKVYTSWSGHHLFTELLENANEINSIGLPSHVDTSALKKILATQDTKKAGTLVRTIGVVHNSTLDGLKSEYTKIEASLLPPKKYQFVYLAGDAPTSDGKATLYYTPEEAYALAKKIGAELDEGTVLLVTNGPRTGQFVPDPSDATKKVKNPLSHHTIDRATLAPVKYEQDAVSAAFIKGLKDAGVVVSEEVESKEAIASREKKAHEKKAQFFDFKFILEKDKDDKPRIVGNSVYKGLLGAVACNSGSTALLPGESISAPSEACDLLPPGSVTVYENKAMNLDHTEYVKSLYSAGQVQLLNIKELPGKSMSFGSLARKSDMLDAKCPSAAQMMTDKILSDIQPLISKDKELERFRREKPLPGRTSPANIASQEKEQSM